MQYQAISFCELKLKHIDISIKTQHKICTENQENKKWDHKNLMPHDGEYIRYLN